MSYVINILKNFSFNEKQYTNYMFQILNAFNNSNM